MQAITSYFTHFERLTGFKPVLFHIGGVMPFQLGESRKFVKFLATILLVLPVTATWKQFYVDYFGVTGFEPAINVLNPNQAT